MDHYLNPFGNFTAGIPDSTTEKVEEFDKKNNKQLKQRTTILLNLVQENKNTTEEEKEDIFRSLWQVIDLFFYIY
jgi:hypothetical protein